MIRHNRDITGPFDVAVVIPSLIRPSLLQTLNSIYRQHFSGTIQILVGADGEAQQPDLLHLWSGATGDWEKTGAVDRSFAEALIRTKKARGTGKASVLYKINRDNILWRGILQDLKGKKQV